MTHNQLTRLVMATADRHRDHPDELVLMSLLGAVQYLDYLTDGKWGDSEHARAAQRQAARHHCAEADRLAAEYPAPWILQSPERAEGGVLIRQLCIAGCEDAPPQQMHLIE